MTPTPELDGYYTALRAISAILSFTAALLIVLKNKHRWRRTSATPLRFGARLWREMLILLMCGLGVAYTQSTFRHAPGVPSTVYIPIILALFVFGLWTEYQQIREMLRDLKENPRPYGRRYDD